MDNPLALSSTLISLHWSPPPSIHINGMLQYYIVNVTETNTGKKWTFIAVDSVLRVGSLHPDYVYEFAVTARTIGNGPYSQPRTVKTREDGKTVCVWVQMHNKLNNVILHSDCLQHLLAHPNTLRCPARHPPLSHYPGNHLPLLTKME